MSLHQKGWPTADATRLVLGRYSVHISAGTPVVLIDFFHSLLHSLQANAGTLPRLGHDRFLPDPFQLVWIIRRYIISVLRVIKQPTEENCGGVRTCARRLYVCVHEYVRKFRPPYWSRMFIRNTPQGACCDFLQNATLICRITNETWSNNFTIISHDFSLVTYE
jgi:hypothetical protein